MFNPFAKSEKNLGRAGWLFITVILGSIALSLVLAEIGFNSDAAIFPLFGLMPFVAWFTSRAAKIQGKSPILYGLLSLFPPLAAFIIFSLYGQDTRNRII